MELYTVSELSKYYEFWNIRTRKKDRLSVIKNMNMAINRNEFICIMGKSGSGKTTVLKMLGGIEQPSSGSVWYENMELYHCAEEKMERYRRKEIGFIFQDYKLLNEMTISENILIPQVLDHQEREKAEKRMEKLTKLFGINDKTKFYPYELSGGEKQRAAICRALINNPKVILADEPTGNLDSYNTEAVLKMLLHMKEKLKKTIILVTHDKEVCKYADRIIGMESGKLIE